jgi:hypothetical protein
MNKLIYIFLLPVVTLSLTSCANMFAPDVYQAQGKTANLSIDVPAVYESGISIYVIDNGRKLVYGVNGRPPQFDTNVKIQADKNMFYTVYYPISSEKYCEQNVSFSLDAGRHYRLLVGITSEKRSALRKFLFGTVETCHVGLVEEISGKLFPIKLNQS